MTAWTIAVPGWHPTPLDRLLHCHWARANRLKRAERRLVGLAARAAGVPRATGRRRVSVALTLAPRRRAADPDAYWKSLLDALVAAGLLTDDNRQGVELGPVSFTRGPSPATSILLEDLGGPDDDKPRPKT